jgi:hypothetical protein
MAEDNIEEVVEGLTSALDDACGWILLKIKTRKEKKEERKSNHEKQEDQSQ